MPSDPVLLPPYIIASTLFYVVFEVLSPLLGISYYTQYAAKLCVRN
jgi:hypothetical protein